MKQTTRTKTKPTQANHLNSLALRKYLRLNQRAFWAPLGVTQSGGSRYESGRRMPPPVAMLLELVYVKGLDPKQVKARDEGILRALKQSQASLQTVKKTKFVKPRHFDPLVLRKDLGLSQRAFWIPLGVTQSGGSRYEAGRRMLPPVSTLIELVYVKGLIPEQFEARDMAILRYLKQDQPDLYASLAKAAGGEIGEISARER